MLMTSLVRYTVLNYKSIGVMQAHATLVRLVNKLKVEFPEYKNLQLIPTAYDLRRMRVKRHIESSGLTLLELIILREHAKRNQYEYEGAEIDIDEIVGSEIKKRSKNMYIDKLDNIRYTIDNEVPLNLGRGVMIKDRRFKENIAR